MPENLNSVLLSVWILVFASSALVSCAAVDDYRDLNGNSKMDPYEDSSLTVAERVDEYDLTPNKRIELVHVPAKFANSTAWQAGFGVVLGKAVFVSDVLADAKIQEVVDKSTIVSSMKVP